MQKIKRYIDKSKWIVAVLIIGFAFRIFISPLGFHVDIFSIASWGEWIYKNGTEGFFSNSIWTYSWPTQLPLANLTYQFTYFIYQQLVWFFTQIAWHIATYRLAPTYMIWWFDFVLWFGTALYQDTSLLWGYLITIKLLAIIADLVIAGIIYYLALKKKFKIPYSWSFVYLFSPFSFYLSSIWGQYDQLVFLLILLSFLFIYYRKLLFLAPVLLLLSVGVKPTTLIFMPLFFWLYFKSKPDFISIFSGVFLFVSLGVFSTLLFTEKNIFDFTFGELLSKVFYKSEFRLSTNSFNFWHIFYGKEALVDYTPFLLIPARLWGYLAFLFLNLYAFRLVKINNIANLFTALSIVGLGSWLFMTNMLERYYFAGVTFLLFLSIYKKGLFKYWLVISLIYGINLYSNFWFPEWLNGLEDLLNYQKDFITRILSTVNVLIFIKILLTLNASELTAKRVS